MMEDKYFYNIIMLMSGFEDAQGSRIYCRVITATNGDL